MTLCNARYCQREIYIRDLFPWCRSDILHPRPSKFSRMCAPIHKVEVVETRKYHQLKHVRNPTSRVSPDCNCMPASCNAHLTFEKATSTLCSVGRYSMTYAAAAKHQFNMFGSAECISRKRWKANIPDLLQNYALELRLCSDRFLGYLNASCGPFNTIHLMSRVV